MDELLVNIFIVPKVSMQNKILYKNVPLSIAKRFCLDGRTAGDNYACFWSYSENLGLVLPKPVKDDGRFESVWKDILGNESIEILCWNGFEWEPTKKGGKDEQ